MWRKKHDEIATSAICASALTFSLEKIFNGNFLSIFFQFSLLSQEKLFILKNVSKSILEVRREFETSRRQFNRLEINFFLTAAAALFSLQNYRFHVSEPIAFIIHTFPFQTTVEQWNDLNIIEEMWATES